MMQITAKHEVAALRTQLKPLPSDPDQEATYGVVVAAIIWRALVYALVVFALVGFGFLIDQPGYALFGLLTLAGYAAWDLRGMLQASKRGVMVSVSNESFHVQDSGSVTFSVDWPDVEVVAIGWVTISHTTLLGSITLAGPDGSTFHLVPQNFPKGTRLLATCLYRLREARALDWADA